MVPVLKCALVNNETCLRDLKSRITHANVCRKTVTLLSCHEKKLRPPSELFLVLQLNLLCDYKFNFTYLKNFH